MPNRIIKDTIRTSKSVNKMTDFQFRLWTYLITYVDDYGRGSADPELLKGFVLPRRKGVTESTIEKELINLAINGSVVLYDVDGEPYFCFPNWGDHQRIQTKKSKFPAPEDGSIRYYTVVHGEIRLESNPNKNPNPNTESKYKSEFTTTTTDSAHAQEKTADISPPSLSEIYAYFKDELCIDNAKKEASLFEAYNANRGWDCLPGWKTSAALWAERIEGHGGST